MLDYIWIGMIVLSLVCSIFTGNTENLSNSVLSSAEDAVTLVIGMSGAVCLWSGFIKILDKSGASKGIAKILSPILSKIFPDVDKNSEAFSAISANVTANLLGLGNAATPLGIKAMQELEKSSELALKTHKATRSMEKFMLMNTSSIQLMPTMILSILSANGCENPSAIIPCVWVSSLAGLLAALGLSEVTSAVKGGKEK